MTSTEPQHADDCWYRGDDCVECGGCDCGLNERTCDQRPGPGCYSIEATDQWRDENGYNEGISYG